MEKINIKEISDKDQSLHLCSCQLFQGFSYCQRVQIGSNTFDPFAIPVKMEVTDGKIS